VSDSECSGCGRFWKGGGKCDYCTEPEKKCACTGCAACTEPGKKCERTAAKTWPECGPCLTGGLARG